jgi:hypothetical protein
MSVVVLTAVAVCQVWLVAAADTTMVRVWVVVEVGVVMAVATVNTAVMGLQLLVVVAVAGTPMRLRA